MAVILKGSNAELLFVNAAGTGTHNLTSFWTGGHPGVSYDQTDVVTFGDNAHRNRQALQDASLDFTFLHDSTASNSYDTMIQLYTSTSARAVVYAPDGTASGAPKWEIPARLFSIDMDGGPGDVLTFSVTFGVDGVATIGTW